MSAENRVDCGCIVQVISGCYEGFIGKIESIYDPTAIGKARKITCTIINNAGASIIVAIDTVVPVTEDGPNTQLV